MNSIQDEGARGGAGVHFNRDSPVAAPKIMFTQINLHKAKEASGQLTNMLSQRHTCVAMVQEPWLFENSICGLSNSGRVFCQAGVRARTCVIVRGLLAELVPKHTSRDLTTIRIRWKDFEGTPKEMIVASAYLHGKDEVPNEALKDLVGDESLRGLELLIGCDSNSHHTLWGSRECDNRGYDLLDFLDRAGLDFANRGTVPTFVGARGHTVIDVTICSAGLVNSIRDWHVLEEDSLSDHRYIEFGLEGRGKEPVYSRNPRHTDWEKYGELLSQRLRDFPSQYGTPEQVDLAVEFLEEAITQSFQESCALTLRKEKKGDAWWNKHLDRLRTKTRKLFRKQKRDPARLRAEYLRTLSQYRKEIRKRRMEGWREYCGEIEGAPAASRLFKILSKGGVNATGWVRKPDGAYPESSRENLYVLLKEHLPDFNPDYGSEVLASVGPMGPADWHMAQKAVGFGRVRWAVGTFMPYKSPGPDGIHPVLLQKGLEALEVPLTKIFRTCIAQGYVPVKWRVSRVAFIPKGGRVGHSVPKDYRPISLMSFLVKTLERLVDRLMEEQLQKSPLSDAQHAYRKGRSTDTALHRVVKCIETGMRGRGAVMAVFIDIVGAFNCTPYHAIAEGARRHGISESIIRWLKMLLTKRLVLSEQDFGKITGQVTDGCPQGGVLSPKLWCLAVDGLLEDLITAGFETVGYSDDIVIMNRGVDVLSLSERMRVALDIVERWCARYGLTVNPDKTECVLFTRRRKLEGVVGPQFYGKTLGLAPKTKYLGLMLDSKLNWSAHENYVAQKFLNGYWLCRRMIGSSWGLRPSMIRWLYRTVLVPRVTYGSVVWWPRAQLVTTGKHLERVQAMLLRGMTGAYAKTPRAALFVALGLMPLHIEVKKAAVRTTARLKVLGEWRGDHGGHGAIGGVPCIRELQSDTDRIVEELVFERRFSVRSTAREEWTTGSHPALAGSTVWYTDGSKSEGNTGSAAWGPAQSTSLTGSAGPGATVFQSEILAIKMCVDELLRRRTRGRRISICADSWAALCSLASPSIVSRIVRECKAALNVLGLESEVTLYWVPAHVGIPGNEKADALAKRGTSILEPTAQVGRPWCDVIEAINRWITEEYTNFWNGVSGCRQAKANLGAEPIYRWHEELLRLQRPETRVVIGWLTGHCYFNRHLHVGRLERPICRFCQEEVETTEHILWNCPAIEGRRIRYLDTNSLGLSEKVPINPLDLLRFIRALDLMEVVG